MQPETIPIGKTSCTFMTMSDFRRMCELWLSSDTFHHVVTLNPEMVVAAEKDAPFREALARSELRPPDGTGLIWARWYLRTQYWPLLPSMIAFSLQKIERVSGVDMVDGLAKLCSDHRQGLYLLGGEHRHVVRVAENLQSRYEGLSVFVSPDHAFDLSGPAQILKDIAEKKPAVVLVAYGAPRQTLWLEAHRQVLAATVRIAVGVGGAFDILSERKPRAPRFMRSLNLEWLWRLYLEPRRLPRIWRAVVEFPALVRRQKRRQRESLSTFS